MTRAGDLDWWSNEDSYQFSTIACTSHEILDSSKILRRLVIPQDRTQYISTVQTGLTDYYGLIDSGFQLIVNQGVRLQEDPEAEQEKIIFYVL